MTKHKSWRYGRFAEGLCAWHLRLRGYRVVARGFRVPVGEIDIVARRGRTLAVIEVKARRDWDRAAAALGAKQRARIGRAASAFMASHDCAGLNVRYDVMLVRPWRLPRHLRGAWRDGDNWIS